MYCKDIFQLVEKEEKTRWNVLLVVQLLSWNPLSKQNKQESFFHNPYHNCSPMAWKLCNFLGSTPSALPGRYKEKKQIESLSGFLFESRIPSQNLANGQLPLVSGSELRTVHSVYLLNCTGTVCTVHQPPSRLHRFWMPFNSNMLGFSCK
jgi:hypothetical protein